MACGQKRTDDLRSFGAYVCSDCSDTQMGRAAKVVAQLEMSAPSNDLIRDLESILDLAQNGPPDGESDGSITELRWNQLTRLVNAARAFNRAIDEVAP